MEENNEIIIFKNQKVKFNEEIDIFVLEIDSDLKSILVTHNTIF